MELIILLLVAACVIGAWWVMNPKEALETVEEVEEAIEELKEEVQEVLESLPTADELKKLTKAKLEELGRELGVELDKRKTKDNMIKELQEKVGK